jgi:hypothetical protein
MLRRLALLAFCLALLGQAAGPALASLSNDCLCVESGCADESRPACAGQAGCLAGSCTTAQAVLAPAALATKAIGSVWIAAPPSVLDTRTPQTDLRPPIG